MSAYCPHCGLALDGTQAPGADLIEAFEKVAKTEEMIASGDPIKVAVGTVMGEWWRGELARLAGSSTGEVGRA